MFSMFLVGFSRYGGLFQYVCSRFLLCFSMIFAGFSWFSSVVGRFFIGLRNHSDVLVCV